MVLFPEYSPISWCFLREVRNRASVPQIYGLHITEMTGCTLRKIWSEYNNNLGDKSAVYFWALDGWVRDCETKQVFAPKALYVTAKSLPPFYREKDANFTKN